MTEGELKSIQTVFEYLSRQIADIKQSLQIIEATQKNVWLLKMDNKKLRNRIKALEELVDQSARREMPIVKLLRAPKRKPGPKKK